ncbi:MAG: tetratricopeptide repeat protein [Candidatus Omnitrophica bacterium]|nr:tetratricopeptide repeat protein [Candidatus Omnitrophota bacterium]
MLDRVRVAKSQAEFLFARGRCFMDLGEDAKAVQAFEQLRREDPEHALAMDAALGMAELFQRRQRFADAMAVLDDVLRQAFDPEQVRQARLRIGALYLAQGDATQASAQFHLANDSRDPGVRQGALNGLGDAQALLGNAQEAERWYDEAMRISRTSPAGLYAVYQLGRLDLQAGRVQEAIERFQWLVNRAQVAAVSGVSSLSHQAAASLQADARLALAFAYLSDAQPDLARAELEWLRGQDQHSPQAARANYYLALLALNDGRFSDAQQLCEEVIDRAPESDEALEARLLLADLLAARAGSPREAMAVLQQAVETLHGSPARHRGRLARKLGDLARQTGDYAQAVHWYEQAWEDLPAQRGELDYRLASCYEEGGDLMAAAARYRSIAQAPWQIRGQLAAAKLMEREERWEDAITIYRFVTQQPVPEAKIAEERLSVLANTQ